jgi:hypothetical protein
LRLLRVTQALAINAVSVYGVFGAHWPVGTAIALYWCENVLRLVMLVLLLGARRRVPPTLGLAVIFNVVHGVFLAVILGALIPRSVPAESLERSSFTLGLAIIAGLLLLELLVWIVSKVALHDAARTYFKRVLVVHITIVIGMFGIVGFGRPQVLFGVFAAMKVLADVFWRSPKLHEMKASDRI